MSRAKRWTMPKVKRNRLEIMRWMLAQEPVLTVTGIGADLEIDYTAVSHTIADRRNDWRVLRYLWNKGCPEKYLALPARLEAELKALQKAA